jgi:hypothetical protein
MRHVMNRRTASSLMHRPATNSAANHEPRPHRHVPTPARPPQTGYYLLRLRLQYGNKGVRPLARIV